MPVAWDIQRGTHDFGASENSEVVSFPSAVVVADAFVRFTNINFLSSGEAAGSTAKHYHDDLAARPASITTTGFTAFRDNNADNEDVRIAYEVWEGDFTVNIIHLFSFTGSQNDLDITLSGFTDIDQCVAVVVGTQSPSGALNPLRNNPRVYIDTGDDTLHVSKSVNNVALMVTVAVLEFDSNYTVQQSTRTVTADDTVETNTITSVEKTDSMIFASHEAAGSQVDDMAWAAFFDEGSGTTTSLRFWIAETATVDAIITAFVVTNSETLEVEHLNSINGSLSQIAESGSPQTTNRTDHTAVSDLDTAGLIVMGGCRDSSSNGGNNAINYRYTSVSNIEYFRTESAGASTNHGDADIAIQAIQFTDPASGDISATEPGLTFSQSTDILGKGAVDATEPGLVFSQSTDIVGKGSIGATEPGLVFTQSTDISPSKGTLIVTEPGLVFTTNADVAGLGDISATEPGLVFTPTGDAANALGPISATEVGLTFTPTADISPSTGTLAATEPGLVFTQSSDISPSKGNIAATDGIVFTQSSAIIDAATGADPISATEPGLVFTESADILGKGSIDATEIGLTFGESADILGKGDIVATEPGLVFTQSTNLGSIASIVATEPGLVFTQSTDILGKGSIVATEPGLVFTQSSDLDDAGADPISATEPGLVFTESADIQGKGSIVVTEPGLVFSESAAILGKGSITATEVGLALSESTAILGTTSLSVTEPGLTFSAVAAILGRAAVSGTSTLVFAPTGILKVLFEDVTATLTFTTSAALRDKWTKDTAVSNSWTKEAGITNPWTKEAGISNSWTKESEL